MGTDCHDERCRALKSVLVPQFEYRYRIWIRSNKVLSNRGGYGGPIVAERAEEWITKMTTQQEKALLADVRAAKSTLGQILDGGHDIAAAFSEESAKNLRYGCLDALIGLSILSDALTAQIGTDNL